MPPRATRGATSAQNAGAASSAPAIPDPPGVGGERTTTNPLGGVSETDERSDRIGASVKGEPDGFLRGRGRESLRSKSPPAGICRTSFTRLF